MNSLNIPRFKLLRYFSAASFAALLIVLIIVLAAFDKFSSDRLLAAVQHENSMLAQVIANELQDNFPGHLSADGAHEKQKMHTFQIKKSFKVLLANLPILKVEIFKGLETIYSTDAKDIGKIKNSSNLLRVQKTGIPYTKLFLSDKFSPATEKRVKKNIVKTYVLVKQLKLHSGKTESLIVEVYSDRTSMIAQNSETKTLIVISTIILFGLFYFVLILIVRRADGVITSQYDSLEIEVAERQRAERISHESTAANQAKSDFLANMSHELRTPLNAIIGFSETLIQGIFGPLSNEKQVEYVRDVHESGKHLLDLINEVLDVSAIEAGKLEIGTTEVDVSSTIEAAMRLVKTRAEQRGVHLEIDLNDLRPIILGDERRVKQIFVNLLTNAVKFTEHGGKVLVGANQNSDGSIALSVVDTGIGIKDEDLAKAMEKFGQIKRENGAEFEGTGLGLPLTKGLVEAHDAHMEIESVVGKGTTVTVVIPRDRVVQQA